ncbi:MAG: tetratricopeptide repeat protein [Candidatus Aminicenantes bacterium]|nr:tetratricopeptide repeat protein [Candidatus Aminicenantes bacterium]
MIIRRVNPFFWLQPNAAFVLRPSRKRTLLAGVVCALSFISTASLAYAGATQAGSKASTSKPAGCWKLVEVWRGDSSGQRPYPDGKFAAAQPSADGKTSTTKDFQVADGVFTADYLSENPSVNYRSSYKGSIRWTPPPRQANPGSAWKTAIQLKIFNVTGDGFYLRSKFSANDHDFNRTFPNPVFVEASANTTNQAVESAFSMTFPGPARAADLQVIIAVDCDASGGFLRIEYRYKWVEGDQVDIEVTMATPSVGAALRAGFAVLAAEPAADQHRVFAVVKNLSKTSKAKDIQVQLWLGRPGEAGSRTVGKPETIPEIDFNEFQSSAWAIPVWPLEGNVDKAPLYVQAVSATQIDPNPGNNIAPCGEVSISFAHNGRRAYSYPTDAYTFPNYGSKQGLGDLVEAWLTTITGQMDEDPKLAELYQRLLYPPLYVRFMEYLKEASDAGGHCYGLCATSSLYFLDDSLRPVPKPTRDLTRSEASFNIAVYQRAQMNSIFMYLMTGHMREQNAKPEETVDRVRASLRDGRKPMMVILSGDNDAHAVLAYKIVDVLKDGKTQNTLYVYDPNTPPPILGNDVLTYLYVLNGGDAVFWPAYTNYQDWVKRWGVQTAQREIPLNEVNAVIPELKQLITQTAELLNSGHKLMVVLRCPAEAVFMDSSGRTTGIRNGSVVKGIPGAEVLASGEEKIFLLPAGNEYSLSVTRRGQGNIDLDIITPGGGVALGLVSFPRMSVTSSTGGTLRIGADNSVSDLTVGTVRQLAATLVRLDGDRPTFTRVNGRPASALEKPDAEKMAGEWKDRGNRFAADGNIPDSERCYRRALEIAPRFAVAWYDLGRLNHVEKKDFKEAERLYRKSLEIDPRHALSYEALGLLYFNALNNCPEAERCFRKAVELDPRYVNAWLNLGQVSDKCRHDPGEAERCFRKAIEFEPRGAFAWKCLGLVLKAQGRMADADVCFQKYRELGGK